MSDSSFHRGLQSLLVEIFDGPPGKEAFVLNPGDKGMLRQLEGIDATTASTRSIPGRTTVAAHTDHVLYGIELLNRWIAGEENPFATADWEGSWKRTTVDDAKWQALLKRFRAAIEGWKSGVAARQDWDDIAAIGALASVAHAAYHLGAIRQILASMNKNDAPA